MSTPLQDDLKLVLDLQTVDLHIQRVKKSLASLDAFERRSSSQAASGVTPWRLADALPHGLCNEPLHLAQQRRFN